ncbi:MAG TPA: DnaJ domain-containing protein [Thermoanaerobaculia bacterium]|nr:DnaJ domain-containing protein [Thermoanaerobaculia bacterium]
MPIDYYAVLGVAREAGADEIRRRFRELARERHPDRFGGDEKARAEREFQALTEAFNVLYDPARRRRHDAELSRPPGRRDEGGRGLDPREVARAWMGRGVTAYREGRYAEAADAFDQATRALPDDGRAWYNLALAASQGERWRERALPAVRRATELDPMNVAHLRAAGRLHARAGDLDAADRYYQQALEWSAGDAAIRAERDELLAARKGRFGRFGRA